MASSKGEARKSEKPFLNCLRDGSPEGTFLLPPEISGYDTRMAILNIEGIKGSLETD